MPYDMIGATGGPATEPDPYLASLYANEPDDDGYHDLAEPVDLGTWRERHKPAGPVKQLPNLPDSFWEARPVLTHIRQAAHHRRRSPDYVLHATLARLSAMVSPQLRFDTGLGDGSLNYFTAVVGHSSAGKTTGEQVARRLLQVPEHLNDTGNDGRPVFSDGLPLGSGEGVAEAFMGAVNLETGAVDQKGHPKTEKVRMQVRSNVFFYVDEGEALTKAGERSGATILPAIRSAWSGGLLGQSNAREETTRIVAAGTYSLGLVIGYQPDTAQQLLADGGPGTPQRFAWCSAVDPSIPDERVSNPGPIELSLVDGSGAALAGTMQAEDAICDELWQRDLAVGRGELIVPELDGHEPLMRSKMAALLALLDVRTTILVSDWELSKVLWETSCAVRDALLEVGRRRTAEAVEAATTAYVEREVRKTAAVDVVGVKVERLAKRLAERVAAEGGMTRAAASRSLAHRDRALFDAVVDKGASEGWFVEGAAGLAAAAVRSV